MIYLMNTLTDKPMYWINPDDPELKSFFNSYHPDPNIDFPVGVAITLSIKKFEFLLNLMEDGKIGWFVTGDARTCALCYFSNKSLGRDSCQNCPIFSMIGVLSCGETPYDDYLSIQEYREVEEEPSALIKFLKDEIAFLRSLPEYDPSVVIPTHIKIVEDD